LLKRRPTKYGKILWGWVDNMPDKTTQGFNISRFKSHVDKTGLLRNNHFLVRIPFPASMQDHGINFTNSNRDIEMVCDTTTFPMTGLQTYNIQRYGYGGAETRPSIPIFGPLQCTFICDRDANMQKFFHEWMKTIVNNDFHQTPAPSTTTILKNGRDLGPYTPIPMYVYELSYKSSYAVDLQLLMFKDAGNEQAPNVVRQINFRDAYPAAVADIPLSWARQNDFIKVPVVFAYTDWFEEPIAK